MSFHKVIQGDCLETLRGMESDSVDAIVCDPPYGLSSPIMGDDMVAVLRQWLGAAGSRGAGFMGKKWDAMVPAPDVWVECMRVLKPGGHALIFGGTRTYDLLTLAVRIAGFEVRDQLAWMYGSGFPKSLDVSKAIDARPGVQQHREFAAHLAERRAAAGLSCQDVAERVAGTRSGACWNWEHHQFPEAKWWPALRDLLGLHAKWGEILAEAERVKTGSRAASLLAVAPGQGSERPAVTLDETSAGSPEAAAWSGWGTALKPAQEPIVLARKPLIATVAANVLAHGTGGINIDACRIETSDNLNGGAYSGERRGSDSTHTVTLGRGIGEYVAPAGRWPANVIFDEEAAAALDEQSCGASRFFYVAKASKSEREAGLDHLPIKSGGELTDREDDSDGLKSPRAGAGRGGGRRNHHPTVKPIALMRYLCRLITPPGGVVLDPYCGSGSTGCAAKLEGFSFIGLELEADYCEIARSRIEAV